jgi:hypothetical protein
MAAHVPHAINQAKYPSIPINAFRCYTSTCSGLHPFLSFADLACGISMPDPSKAITVISLTCSHSRLVERWPGGSVLSLGTLCPRPRRVATSNSLRITPSEANILELICRIHAGYIHQKSRTVQSYPLNHSKFPILLVFGGRSRRFLIPPLDLRRRL